MIPWVEDLLMVPVGMAAGVLNFAAAGGSLLPFLVLTWLGYPALVANATTLCATPLSFIPAFREIKRVPRVMTIPLVFSLGATAVGCWIIADVLPARVFQQIVPILLILSVVVLLAFRRVKDHANSGARGSGLPKRALPIVLTAGFGLTSAYAGAFGGSVATMILAFASRVTTWRWEELQRVKRVLCLFTSVVGLIAWASTGLVLWPQCTVLGASMVVGSLIGQRVTNKIPDRSQRTIVAVVTLVSAAYLWAAQ